MIVKNIKASGSGKNKTVGKSKKTVARKQQIKLGIDLDEGDAFEEQMLRQIEEENRKKQAQQQQKAKQLRNKAPVTLKALQIEDMEEFQKELRQKQEQENLKIVQKEKKQQERQKQVEQNLAVLQIEALKTIELKIQASVENQTIEEETGQRVKQLVKEDPVQNIEGIDRQQRQIKFEEKEISEPQINHKETTQNEQSQKKIIQQADQQKEQEKEEEKGEQVQVQVNVQAAEQDNQQLIELKNSNMQNNLPEEKIIANSQFLGDEDINAIIQTNEQQLIPVQQVMKNLPGNQYQEQVNLEEQVNQATDEQMTEFKEEVKEKQEETEQIEERQEQIVNDELNTQQPVQQQIISVPLQTGQLQHSTTQNSQPIIAFEPHQSELQAQSSPISIQEEFSNPQQDKSQQEEQEATQKEGQEKHEKQEYEETLNKEQEETLKEEQEKFLKKEQEKTQNEEVNELLSAQEPLKQSVDERQLLMGTERTQPQQKNEIYSEYKQEEEFESMHTVRQIEQKVSSNQQYTSLASMVQSQPKEQQTLANKQENQNQQEKVQGIFQQELQPLIADIQLLNGQNQLQRQPLIQQQDEQQLLLNQQCEEVQEIPVETLPHKQDQKNLITQEKALQSEGFEDDQKAIELTQTIDQNQYLLKEEQENQMRKQVPSTNQQQQQLNTQEKPNQDFPIQTDQSTTPIEKYQQLVQEADTNYINRKDDYFQLNQEKIQDQPNQITQQHQQYKEQNQNGTLYQQQLISFEQRDTTQPQSQTEYPYIQQNISFPIIEQSSTSLANSPQLQLQQPLNPINDELKQDQILQLNTKSPTLQPQEASPKLHQQQMIPANIQQITKPANISQVKSVVKKPVKPKTNKTSKTSKASSKNKSTIKLLQSDMFEQENQQTTQNKTQSALQSHVITEIPQQTQIRQQIEQEEAPTQLREEYRTQLYYDKINQQESSPHQNSLHLKSETHKYESYDQAKLEQNINEIPLVQTKVTEIKEESALALQIRQNKLQSIEQVFPDGQIIKSEFYPVHPLGIQRIEQGKPQNNLQQQEQLGSITINSNISSGLKPSTKKTGKSNKITKKKPTVSTKSKSLKMSLQVQDDFVFKQQSQVIQSIAQVPEQNHQHHQEISQQEKVYHKQQTKIQEIRVHQQQQQMKLTDLQLRNESSKQQGTYLNEMNQQILGGIEQLRQTNEVLSVQIGESKLINSQVSSDSNHNTEEIPNPTPNIEQSTHIADKSSSEQVIKEQKKDQPQEIQVVQVEIPVRISSGAVKKKKTTSSTNDKKKPSSSINKKSTKTSKMTSSFLTNQINQIITQKPEELTTLQQKQQTFMKDQQQQLTQKQVSPSVEQSRQQPTPQTHTQVDEQIIHNQLSQNQQENTESNTQTPDHYNSQQVDQKLQTQSNSINSPTVQIYSNSLQNSQKQPSLIQSKNSNSNSNKLDSQQKLVEDQFIEFNISTKTLKSKPQLIKKTQTKKTLPSTKKTQQKSIKITQNYTSLISLDIEEITQEKVENSKSDQVIKSTLKQNEIVESPISQAEQKISQQERDNAQFVSHQFDLKDKQARENEINCQESISNDKSLHTENAETKVKQPLQQQTHKFQNEKTQWKEQTLPIISLPCQIEKQSQLQIDQSVPKDQQIVILQSNEIQPTQIKPEQQMFSFVSTLDINKKKKKTTTKTTSSKTTKVPTKKNTGKSLFTSKIDQFTENILEENITKTENELPIQEKIEIQEQVQIKQLPIQNSKNVQTIQEQPNLYSQASQKEIKQARAEIIPINNASIQPITTPTQLTLAEQQPESNQSQSPNLQSNLIDSSIDSQIVQEDQNTFKKQAQAVPIQQFEAQTIHIQSFTTKKTQKTQKTAKSALPASNKLTKTSKNTKSPVINFIVEQTQIQSNQEQSTGPHKPKSFKSKTVQTVLPQRSIQSQIPSSPERSNKNQNDLNRVITIDNEPNVIQREVLNPAVGQSLSSDSIEERQRKIIQKSELSYEDKKQVLKKASANEQSIDNQESSLTSAQNPTSQIVATILKSQLDLVKLNNETNLQIMRQKVNLIREMLQAKLQLKQQRSEELNRLSRDKDLEKNERETNLNIESPDADCEEEEDSQEQEHVLNENIQLKKIIQKSSKNIA